MIRSDLITPSEPLYRVVARKVLERINDHQYASGQPLPPEPELGRAFGVSRTTVRQALALLKRDGLVYSKSGVGTIVRTPAAPGRMRMTGSLADLTNYGAETHYKPIGRVCIAPSQEAAETLGLAPRDRVIRFWGLRSRPGEPPFGFEEVQIPEALGHEIDNTSLGGRTFFSLIEEAHGVQIAEVRQIITATSAPAHVSRHLGIASRSPVLRVSRSYHLASGRGVELAVSHLDPLRFEYVMTLYRD